MLKTAASDAIIGADLGRTPLQILSGGNCMTNRELELIAARAAFGHGDGVPRSEWGI